MSRDLDNITKKENSKYLPTGFIGTKLYNKDLFSKLTTIPQPIFYTHICAFLDSHTDVYIFFKFQ